MHCSKCQQQLAENVMFCSGCGTRVDSAPLATHKIDGASSFLPWGIAIFSAFVALTVVVWALLWVNIGNSNGNVTLAQAEYDQRLESIDQRLGLIEQWFDLTDQRNESIEQRLGYIEIWFDSANDWIWSLEQIFAPQQEVVFKPLIPPGGFREHFIEPGQSLASIAQIYWPHNPETPSGRIIRDQLVAHLAETNNIANPEILFAGTWLLIYEHPHIEQVFD